MIPLWLKILYTAFVAVLVPVYWLNYGLANFLWFSDIAVLVTAVAIWLENRLLASMMAIAVLLPEMVWNVAFFGRLLTDYEFAGLVGYMFDLNVRPFLRSLSLFHIFLPILLLWLVWRLGYDRRAFPAMTLASWLILPFTYFFTDPSDNINWVVGIGERQQMMPPLAYLASLMILLPMVVYLPTHWLLQAIFTSRD